MYGRSLRTAVTDPWTNCYDIRSRKERYVHKVAAAAVQLAIIKLLP
jgi:hypothetical protein